MGSDRICQVLIAEYMKLHAAILNVLKDHTKGLTAREIADIINKRKLYTQEDGTPVPPNQIQARINRKTYSHLFSKNHSSSHIIYSKK